MCRWAILPFVTLVLAMVMAIVAVAAQISYSSPSPLSPSPTPTKPLPPVHPGRIFFMPWDVEPLLAEGHERWRAQVAELGAALERFHLQGAADRLWAITERAVRGLAGQPFPSRAEALNTVRYMLDGLIASGVAILKHLIKKARSGAG